MMELVNKINAKVKNNMECEGITVAFLGDSVTQGTFEIDHFEQQYSYERVFSEMMAILFPSVPINVINAGISGDYASHGLQRVERDIIRHAPDLTVVCYGLNDCAYDADSINRYTSALKGIFEKIIASGSELIFMTPNMMCTYYDESITVEWLVNAAKSCAAKQNDGTFDAHIDAVKALCKDMNVPVCDCYAIWKTLSAAGMNVTEHLANKINHPTHEMNRIFAYELIRTIFTENK
jgi:lysophospholipase L1-like esterase